MSRRTKYLASRLPGMINCREAEEFIDAHLDGTLSFGERVKFRVHLAICRECRAYVADYRATRNAVKSASNLSAPATEEMPEELVRAILASRRPPDSR